MGAYRTPSPWGGHLDVVQHAGAWPEREVRGPFHGARDADRAAGRAGFVARGIKYVLIGLLYIRISVGSGGGQADRQGALHEIATQLFGKVMLWALTVGFAAMLLLRGAPAVLTTGRQQKAGSRLLDGGWPVFYTTVCWTTAVYAAGADRAPAATRSRRTRWHRRSNCRTGKCWWTQGCLLIGIGGVLAVRAALRSFLRQLDSAAMSRRTKQVVSGLGVGRGVVRGVVFAAAGIFILPAAVRFDPDDAKGVDATLRSFTQTPAGPWLLVAVAIGLIRFGVFSLASARRRRL